MAPQPLTHLLRSHRARQAEERLAVGAVWQGERWGGLVFSDKVGRPLYGIGVTRRFQELLDEAGSPGCGSMTCDTPRQR